MENRNNSVWTNDNAFYLCLFLKIAILFFIIIPFAQYFYFTHSEEVFKNSENDSSKLEPTINTTLGSNQTLVKRFKMQPTCPLLNKNVILQALLQVLYIKKEMCLPQDMHDLDKHKIPKAKMRAVPSNKVAEPRGTIVVYFAVGLLLTSLLAAFLEVYKAKAQPAKTKVPLTRKCSLADLTVLRHNRKELVRRESILEGGEGFSKATAAKPAPLHRRCSFPVAPGDYSQVHNNAAAGSMGMGHKPISGTDSRRTSVDNVAPEHRHFHARLIRRC